MSRKIWILNHFAGNMYRNQGGRHYWFAKYLKRFGERPTVFCCNAIHNGTGNFFQDDSLWDTHMAEEIQVPFVFVKGRSYVGNGLGRILNMIDFYRNVKIAAKEYARKYGVPDIIYASSPQPLTLLAGIQLAKHFQVKCICEVRDLWPEAIFRFGKAKENSLLGRVLICGEHWIYKKADTLIFTKEGDTDYLKEKKWTTAQGGDIDLEKCHYINNGVDIATYDRNITGTVFDDGDLDAPCFNVIYAGAIRPVNHVGNILDAATIISANKKYEKIQFLIFGDGNELSTLKDRVENENIFNVKLKGLVERKYIPYILSKSSVNILNYSQQQYNWTRGSSSNKLFEYMASGKPIISTIHMGYSIINRYRCGVELEADTPEALAEQVMRFYDMGKEQLERMGENARNGAKDFDIGIMAQKLVKAIESVMK